MADHSPLPWTYTREPRPPGWLIKIVDANGNPVFLKQTFAPRSARDEANAKLIGELTARETSCESNVCPHHSKPQPDEESTDAS